MRVHLLSAYPEDAKNNFSVSWLKESAAASGSEHQIVEDPGSADIILFAENHPPHDPYFFEVAKHPVFRKYKSKCFLYHDCDYVVPIFRGIYPSVEATTYNPQIMRSGPYIARISQNEAIAFVDPKPQPAFLFSFVGAARTHPVRERILSLPDKSAHLVDTSQHNLWELQGEKRAQYLAQYVETCLKSSFVLCPRGVGPNSYRLYEVMEMGIPPVIISDEWVPMPGPDWAKFSIQIAEKDVEKIPDILQARVSDVPEMGRLARAAWEQWFEKSRSFPFLVSMCVEMGASRIAPTKWERLAPFKQFLQPFHLKNLARYVKNRYLRPQMG